MKQEREATVEARLRDEMTRRGCLCYKWVSPGNTGVPDRIIITPRGEFILIELKTERGRLSAVQKTQIRQLRAHGVETWVLYGAEDVARFIKNYDMTNEVARFIENYDSERR